MEIAKKKTERRERKGKTSLQELANAPRVTAVTQQYNPITLSCNPTFPLPRPAASTFFLLSTPSPLLVSTLVSTNLLAPPSFLWLRGLQLTGVRTLSKVKLTPFHHCLAPLLIFSDLLLTDHRMLSLSLFYSRSLRQLSLLISHFASPLFSLSQPDLLNFPLAVSFS